MREQRSLGNLSGFVCCQHPARGLYPPKFSSSLKELGCLGYGDPHCGRTHHTRWGGMTVEVLG